MRLMGNKAEGAEPNTLTVLAGDDIARSRNGVNDPVPLLVNGNVAVEVPGTYNAEIQQYILLNTTNGEGNWIPGGSPYIASRPPANSTNTTPPQMGTAACANGDLACRSGVGAQQNPSTSLSPEQQTAVAEFLGTTKANYERLAYGATLVGRRDIALAYELAAFAAGAVEQVIRPDLGAVTVDGAVSQGVESLAKKYGVPELAINEITQTPEFKAMIQPVKNIINEATK